ncbi:AMIN domain-containing protein [Oryzomonas japonica]|uniref:AMIN domain-containing protein n=2 Tax=Oryzomonas japonica TaxID=2603858 RepID=A0A7J4ZM76_9BACT|nr:AMIN domain-containing protein [Oryzomonas japonica]
MCHRVISYGKVPEKCDIQSHYHICGAVGRCYYYFWRRGSMKRRVVIVLSMLVIALSAVSAFAAELLDVKPVVTGSDLIVEILADIPLTYTYYKIPGQARAVVDIADVDPEKVEPLIVVNKGAVSSISVDKAQITGMVVSRLIFNLVAETDISVTATADRKKLSVVFSGGKPADNSAGKPVVPAVESALAAPSPSAGAASAAPAALEKETDPLGLDEPPAAPVKDQPAVKEPDKPTPLAVVPVTVPSASAKLEPVVPAFASPRKQMVITAIKVGTTSIDVEANGSLESFEQIKLAQPNRLAIDVPGATASLSVKSIPVRRFGLDQIRVGRYPNHVRIVLDAGSSPFPKYDVKPTEKGLRISFK